jgi:hypothetical protein
LVGSPIRTARLAHERLTKKTALAIFASDALSSTAYATEQILLVLAAAYLYGQADAFGGVVSISIAISILLVIVAIVIARRFTLILRGRRAVVAKDNRAPFPAWWPEPRCWLITCHGISISGGGRRGHYSATLGTRFAGLHNHRISCACFLSSSSRWRICVRARGRRHVCRTQLRLHLQLSCLIIYGLVFNRSGMRAPITEADLKIAEDITCRLRFRYWRSRMAARH